MQVELKPCPFCESRVISEYRDWDYWIIKCAQCGVEIAHTQHHKACFAWNRRKGEEVGERLEERMAEAYQLAGSIAFDHDINGPEFERLLDLLSGINLSKDQ